MQWIGTQQLQNHLVALREFYRARRDDFQTSLEHHFSDLADWTMPQGGLFFWLTLKKLIDTRALMSDALAANVAFIPGEPIFPDPENNLGHLRLNFSHIDPQRLDEGLRRLADVIRTAHQQQAA
ncbi:hypothetical protein PD374_17790 [Pseudomonas sp. WCS374]|nr:hypothetical protein PD374_17790 [Pseudomonas sp. WCS374]